MQIVLRTRRRVLSTLRRLKRRLLARLQGGDRYFLADVRTVVHIGANTGQARHTYDAYGLTCTWIEPVPRLYAQLGENIRYMPGQRALQALLADKVDEKVHFHVSNFNGLASSMFELGEHDKIWPEVFYTETIELHTTTLNRLIDCYNIVLETPAALILDVQGAELRVLQGAGNMLGRFLYVKVEATDFAVYQGGCTLEELTSFLEKNGFCEIERQTQAATADRRKCYDVLFKAFPAGQPWRT